MKFSFISLFFLVMLCSCGINTPPHSAVIPVYVGMGYSGTSVNATIFRQSSVASWHDTQYVAFYDTTAHLVIGRRTLSDTTFTLQQTPLTGNIKDAHNVISIMPDGEGYLHVAFDHHDHPLHYTRALTPGSLHLGPLEHMTDTPDEEHVSYPEFYRFSNGDLLFAYRNGASGRGNLVLNRYNLATHSWHRLQDVLISGEDLRSAYWQIFVDDKDAIHISWVWRETWMVETNHDLCYACSTDGGVTWHRSDGTPYQLPITAETAEIAAHVTEGSDLINQTSMCVDSMGHPYIATYWCDVEDSIPQYRLVYHNGQHWETTKVGHRTTPFSLKGGGTKMIPICRPRVVVNGHEIWYFFRDSERQSRVSMYYTPNFPTAEWVCQDLTDFSVDAWEPSFDQPLWLDKHRLHLYVQCVHQGDGERSLNTAPTPINIYEVY